MMRNGADEDDMFGPNPFRSASMGPTPGSRNHQGGDLLESPMVFQQQQQPEQAFLPSPPLQPVYAPQELSGTMDRRQDAPQQPPSQEVFSTPFASVNRCLNCFRLDGYRPYFDLDTIHVMARLKAALTQFHLPDHFRTVVVGQPAPPNSPTEAPDSETPTKGPDLYGPLWVTLTLVFVIAMTSNMVAARHSHSRTADASVLFEYDIVHLLRATSIVTTFAWLVPTLLCVACACLGLSGGNLPSWPMWMCVYGYCLTPYIPACLLLAVWPLGILVWLYLGLATAASGLLVVRNLCGPLLLLPPDGSGAGAGGAKATPILFSMLGSHAVFLIVLKVVFYSK